MHTASTPAQTAWNHALSLLARREHSQAELREKLQRKGHDAAAVEQALNALAKRGYQSDRRFVDSQLRQRAHAQGNRRLRAWLHVKGVASEIVSEALAQSGDETGRALAAGRRFQGRIPDKSSRDKAARFLLHRGFSWEAVRHALIRLATLPEPGQESE